MSIKIAQNACRVCLVEQEIMINLFDTVEEFQKQRLSDLLEDCSDLKINENDEQPKLICDECTSELLVVAKFREKCQRTLLVLMKFQGVVDTAKESTLDDIESEKEMNDDENKPKEVDETVDDEEEAFIIEEFEDEIEDGNESSEEVSNREVFYEDVAYIDNDPVEDDDGQFAGEQIIVFEPEGDEEEIVKGIDVEHSISESTDVERELFERAQANANKKLNTDVAARPLVINCKCDACGAGFTHVNNLTRHLQTHSPDEIFFCVTCKHPFTTFTSLEAHSTEHENDKEILDPNIVDESCKAKENLTVKSESPPRKKSQQKHSGDTPRSEDNRKAKICSECDKPFVSKSALEAHMRTHTGDRPFECDQCPKTFRTQGGLVLHLRRHTGLRPYECNVCGKGFGESSNLRVHMRTHTGEKPHKCTICNRSFARVFLLQIHQRTHTGERPYQCSFCDKAFAQRGDLVSHRRTHTGERPHVCPYCKKGFIKSSGLTQHMRKHMKSEKDGNETVYRLLFANENKDEMDYNMLIVEKNETVSDMLPLSSHETKSDTEIKIEGEIKMDDCILEFSGELEA